MPTTVRKTIGPTGDYATWGAAWDGEKGVTGTPRDLVTEDIVLELAFQAGEWYSMGNQEFAYSATDEWVWDATHYVVCTQETPHNGVWSEAAGGVQYSGGTGIFLWMNDVGLAGLLRADGLQVKHDRTGASSATPQVFRNVSPVSNLLFRGSTGASITGTTRVVEALWSGVTIQVTNSVFVQKSDSATNLIRAFHRAGGSADLHADHCTVIRGAGDGGADRIRYRNCDIHDRTGDDFAATVKTGSTNNASSDATAPGDNPVINASVTREDPASDDYRVISGDTVNAGTDLGVSTDITGAARPSGGGFDIGAFEASGATGQLLTVESVTHVGAWTDELGSSVAADIASSIGGETANDATFAQSEVSPSSSPLVFKFTNASAPSSSTDPHTVTVRIAKDAAGGDQINLTLELREGYVSEASPGTLIASDTFLNLSDTIAESVLTLTQGEAESITDWTALYGRVVATVPA